MQKNKLNICFHDFLNNDHKNIVYELTPNLHIFTSNPFDNILHLDIVINFTNDLSISNIEEIYKILKTFWIENNDKLEYKIIYGLSFANNGKIQTENTFSFVNLISPKTHNKALSIICLIKIFTHLTKIYNLSSNTLDKIIGFARLNDNNDILLSTIKQKDIENVFNEL